MSRVSFIILCCKFGKISVISIDFFCDVCYNGDIAIKLAPYRFHCAIMVVVTCARLIFGGKDHEQVQF